MDAACAPFLDLDIRHAAPEPVEWKLPLKANLEMIMPDLTMDKTAVIAVLNKILEAELAGVVRYTHYSFMVYGYNRIPIVKWLREQAEESMLHAQQAGELITMLGGHPSFGIGKLLESEKHDIGSILRESLEHEHEALDLYRQLLQLTKDVDVMLEEYARQMIAEETQHAGEVDKMLRQPGDYAPVPLSIG